MSYCHCPVGNGVGVRETQPKDIKFIADSIPFTEETIFWMLPGCNTPNSYDFGGVCLEVKLTPGMQGFNESVFNPEPLGPLVKPGMLWGEYRGALLARINWIPGTISVLYATEGSTWKASDFQSAWDVYIPQKSFFKLGNKMCRMALIAPFETPICTYSISNFRTLSQNGELFNQIGPYSTS